MPPLDEYRRKRDFSRTAEPEGGAIEASESGRLFVVQKHAARQLHYDLRLELDGVLKSWAVPRGPSLDPAEKPLAVHTEDHPLEYARFEGAIPKGEYGGGTVMLWDAGEWEPLEDPLDGLARGDLKFRLHGEKLRGAWVLARMSGESGGGGKNWLLIKKRDEAARSVRAFNVLSEQPLSVASGRTMEEIAADPEAVWTGGREQLTDSGRRAREQGGDGRDGRPVTAPRRGQTGPDPSGLTNAKRAALPERPRPMLATSARTPPDGEGWLHEIKLDGYRLLARFEGGAVTLLTRNGHDWTGRFDGVARALARLRLESAVLDGEVVVLDARGVSDFQALQNAFRGYGGASFVYYLFDVPWAGGYDLRRAPLLERKGYLEGLLAAAPAAAPTVQYCDHIAGRGQVVYEQAAAAGLEGIIAKRADSAYECRRSEAWVKVKCLRRETFVVGGYTAPSGSRSGFGALLLGQHDPAGRLVYCGRVGTGFSDRTLEALEQELLARRRDEAPFVDPAADPDWRVVDWVAPELVVEVEFIAWTGDGLVRHPAYLGLREDLAPPDVRVESRSPGPGGGRPVRHIKKVSGQIVNAPASPNDANVAGVRISNPTRRVYPDDGFTKNDVAEYYARIGPWILPHVVNRPLSLVRCPLGLAGEAFYQRQLGEGFPEPLRGLEIDGDHAIAIDDLAGLLSLVQMGVLEIHPWGCREDQPDRPDQLIFDLDPGPGVTWEHVVESGRFIRRHLEQIGLRSFPKTSGGKGLHLVVPLVPESSWEEAKAFSLAVARDIVRLAPRNFVATMARAQREHRIFIDYLRNQKGSTSVAVFSTRARDGATVSSPLRWDDLSAGLGPRDLTIATVPERLESDGDPWEGFFEVRQRITEAMKKKVGASPLDTK